MDITFLDYDTDTQRQLAERLLMRIHADIMHYQSIASSVEKIERLVQENPEFFDDPVGGTLKMSVAADKLERVIAWEKNSYNLRNKRAVDSICDMVQDAANKEFFNFPLPGALKPETAERTLAHLLQKHHAKKSRR